MVIPSTRPISDEGSWDITVRRNSRYLGAGITVWASHNAWFWRLINARCGPDIIGVTASEDEAVREARVAMQDMSAAHDC